MSLSAGFEPAFSAGTNSSVAVNGDSSPKDVVEASIADDPARDKVIFHPLDSQIDRSQKDWLSIVEAGEVQTLLRAVL